MNMVCRTMFNSVLDKKYVYHNIFIVLNNFSFDYIFAPRVMTRSFCIEGAYVVLSFNLFLLKLNIKI